MAIRATTIFVSDTPLSKYWSRKNVVSANTVASTSNKKYLWTCSNCNNEFERSVASIARTENFLCKECAYKQRVLKTQELRLSQRGNVLDFERLASTWDYAHNDIDPEKVLPNSCKLYWWVCLDCGSSYQRSAAEQNRAKDCVCYECSVKRRKKVKNKEPKIKSTAIIKNAGIYRLWSANNHLSPNKITIYSRIKCLFVCSKCGEEFERTPKMVTAGQVLCKDCGRKKATLQMSKTKQESDFNSIEDNPIMAEMWDYEKNIESPSLVPQYTKRRFFWKCSKCGKRWQAKPSQKKYPLCSNCIREIRIKVHQQNAIKKKGSFGELYPQWASEWNVERNDGLTAYDVLPSSGKMYYFTCKCGHEYKTSPYERIRRHAGCPECHKMAHTSFTEQAISFYLEKCVRTIANFRTEVGLELDAFLPDVLKAVEYDGSHWHSQAKSKNRDERTTKFCQENGIMLVRVKEISKGENEVKDGEIYFNFRKNDFQWLMDSLCTLLELEHINTDIENDSPKILARCSVQSVKTSFEAKRPELIDYWDYKKNLPIKPNMIGYTSEHILSWHCPICGLRYKATPKTVSMSRYHCPNCSEINRKINLSKARRKR